LLVRDLAGRKDAQISAVVAIVARIQPDILLLNDFDYDYGGVALDLMAGLLAQAGVDFPYLLALPPNAGLQSGVDLDGDGQVGGAGDAQGYGGFYGRQSMAILSRYPFDAQQTRDFSTLLWKDFPDNSIGNDWPSGILKVQRLSYKGHWDVPVNLPDGRRLHVLAAHASPPVFDDARNINGARNRDEIRFWRLYLNGVALGGYGPRTDEPFVILGDLNADVADGEGDHRAIKALISHPLVRDARPASRGAVIAAQAQGGGNLRQLSPAALDTVDWDERRTPGNMRVDYVLPSADLKVTSAGVFWPAPDEDGFELIGSSGDVASHHRLVWVDIE